jgi:hypothetical protein
LQHFAHRLQQYWIVTLHRGKGCVRSGVSGFQVGEVAVRVECNAEIDLNLAPPLAHFRADADNPSVDLQIGWISDLTAQSRGEIFDSGSIWKLYWRDSHFCFDFSAPLFGPHPYKRMLIDDQFRRAQLFLNRESFTSFAGEIAPLDYPLDELLIMHRLTQERGIELHACGIVMPDGTGNLFVGHSGAGKSTTTRLWTARHDVLVLSDDRIIVRANSSDSETCRAMRMYGTPWHGDAMYASPESAPLARIFMLEHGHGNTLKQLSSSEAVAELFARSFVPFHRHEYVESALAFLEEVAAAVPCYRYAFEPNDAAVETIINFRD